jgi:hypothetical protein
MNYETHTIEACIDCVMLVANGDIGDCSEEYTEAHEAGMEETWPFMDGWRMSVGDQDMGFSMQRCEGCGSRLGGDRHEMHVMREVKNA